MITFFFKYNPSCTNVSTTATLQSAGVQYGGWGACVDDRVLPHVRPLQSLRPTEGRRGSFLCSSEKK